MLVILCKDLNGMALEIKNKKKVYEQWNNPEMEDLTHFTNSLST